MSRRYKRFGELSRSQQWRVRRRVTPPGQRLASPDTAASEHARLRRREVAYDRISSGRKREWGRLGLTRSDFLSADSTLEHKRAAAAANIALRLGDKADARGIAAGVSTMSPRQLDRAARASQSDLERLAARKAGRDRSGPWGTDRQGRPIEGSPWWYHGLGRPEAS
jgi:hypothetical protein